MLQLHGLNGESEDFLSEEEESKEEETHANQHPGQHRDYDHKHAENLERDLDEPVEEQRKDHVARSQVFGEAVEDSSSRIGIEEGHSRSEEMGEHLGVESLGLRQSDCVDHKYAHIPTHEEENQKKEKSEAVERSSLLSVVLLDPLSEPL